MTSFYDLKPLNQKEQPQPLADLKGKVVLIVNVASKCGFTPQYRGLRELDEKFRSKGLVILGFPCNQFNCQEPGLIKEIISFCQASYGVDFPIMAKVHVNGPTEDPLYTYLKLQKSSWLGFRRILWNFEKFVIDKEGNVVLRHWSLTSPSRLESRISRLLNEQPHSETSSKACTV